MISHPPPPTPTRAQLVGAIVREGTILALAFAAGAGGYLAIIASDPLRWQDFAGAIGAGATAALLKLFPAPQGGGRG